MPKAPSKIRSEVSMCLSCVPAKWFIQVILSLLTTMGFAWFLDGPLRLHSRLHRIVKRTKRASVRGLPQVN